MEEDTASTPPRVARVSRWMASVCLALVAALPIAIALIAFLDPKQVMRGLADVGITSLDQRGQIIVFVVSMVSSLPLMWGLFQLRGLFLCYAAGDVFSQAASRFLSRFALALLLDAGAKVLSRTVQVLLLTMDSPPGQRALSIGISSDEIGKVFLGVTFMVVAWVMAEAAKVADENRSFL